MHFRCLVVNVLVAVAQSQALPPLDEMGEYSLHLERGDEEARIVVDCAHVEAVVEAPSWLLQGVDVVGDAGGCGQQVLQPLVDDRPHH